jgi:hypothetical protein
MAIGNATLPPPMSPGEVYETTHDVDRWTGAERSDLDWNYSNAPATQRSNKTVVRRFVKNNSGIALLPKYLVVLSADGKEATGYARLGSDAGGSELGYPVDEFLPSAGAANGEGFYIVVEGPATVVSSKQGGAENNIASGDILIAATAAASTFSTTAGRAAVLAGATSVLALNKIAAVGIGLTAKTTDQTDADILIDVGRIK